MPGTYLSCADLARDTLRMAEQLPPEIAGIVGIARCGMMPAALLATHLHLPLYEVETLLDGTHLGHGKRLDAPTEHPLPLLLVDDACGPEARTMAVCRRQLAYHGITEVFSAVVYPRSGSPGIDYFGRVVEWPRFLEWSTYNGEPCPRMMLDFDGVVCTDPPKPEESYTEEEFRKVLAEARPRFVPRRLPVAAIVSARLEKYRDVTIEWLRYHGAEYQRLELIDQPTAEARRLHVSIAQYKAHHYARSRCIFFVESNPDQAQEIARITQKLVACPDTGKVYG